MRRLWILVLGAALLLPLAAPQALAAPAWESTRSYNAFWHVRRNIDNDTYVRITWYAGVYEQSEGFWSDLYRSTRRCERRPGRDRCREGAYMVGVIEDLGDGAFTIDEGLNTGYFEATYPMEVYDGNTERDAGRIHIAVDLTGVGDLTSSRESYTYEEGCFRYSYSSRSSYRQAVANGTLTFLRTDATRDLGDTEDANIGVSRYRSRETNLC